jgi:hypothetical protein
MLDRRNAYVKCGLLLFTDDRHTSVTIQCHANIDRNGYLERIQNRDICKYYKVFTPFADLFLDQRVQQREAATVEPSYVSSLMTDKFPIQLHQLGNSLSRYWLRNMKGVYNCPYICILSILIRQP